MLINNDYNFSYEYGEKSELCEAENIIKVTGIKEEIVSKDTTLLWTVKINKKTGVFEYIKYNQNGGYSDFCYIYIDPKNENQLKKIQRVKATDGEERSTLTLHEGVVAEFSKGNQSDKTLLTIYSKKTESLPQGAINYYIKSMINPELRKHLQGKQPKWLKLVDASGSSANITVTNKNTTKGTIAMNLN